MKNNNGTRYEDEQKLGPECMTVKSPDSGWAQANWRTPEEWVSCILYKYYFMKIDMWYYRFLMGHETLALALAVTVGSLDIFRFTFSAYIDQKEVLYFFSLFSLLMEIRKKYKKRRKMLHKLNTNKKYSPLDTDY